MEPFLQELQKVRSLNMVLSVSRFTTMLSYVCILKGGSTTRLKDSGDTEYFIEQQIPHMVFQQSLYVPAIDCGCGGGIGFYCCSKR